MPALKIVVTTAGRDALRNAQADGSNAVNIASIGVTATAVTPTPALAVLPDEIKRLTTISGGATAADTMHVTIRDDSTDSYSLRAIALYLQDGTLFAAFGQSDVLLEKSAQATVLLATDVQFTDIDATQLVFGDTNFQLAQATTEAVGLVELATSTETTAGTDAMRVVTPSGLLAALNARLGAGAPTDFVKTLLAKATALAFVTALGIRGAASYDTGTGNGLDADKLDGQDGAYYRAYGNLTGVPATFAPSAHQHSAADITSGTLPVARGGTGAATLTTGSYLLGNGTDPVAAKTPAQVLIDIGAAAKVHSHAQSDINGLVDALAAKAPLASPGLTGTPTAPTAASATNTTQIATTAFVQTVIANVINGAPGALDTLRELADAMGDDPNFAATITNALATKLDLKGGALTGPLTGTSAAFSGSITSGGTFVGSGSSTFFGNTSSGALVFRPAGINSTSGQMTIDGSGNASISGNLTGSGTAAFSGSVASSQVFFGNSTSTIFANSAAGSLFFRPNGVNSGVGQVIISGDGSISTAGGLNCGGISSSGSITAASTVNAVTFFNSTSANACLATAGAGNVILRPNGPQSTTGQMTIDSNGNVVAAGSITSSGTFVGSGSSTFFGNDSSGSLVFRPAGINSTNGQMTIDSSGNASIAGSITVANGINGQLPSTNNVTGLNDALNARVSRSEFTHSFSTNGWAKLPDGRIEQWGFLSAANVGDGTTGTITFPMAFPNACLNVDVSDRRNTDATKDVDCYAYVNGTPSNSSFGYYVMAPAGSPNYWQGLFWRAIGY